MTEPSKITADEIHRRFGLELDEKEVPVRVYMRHWVAFVRHGSWLSLLLVLLIILAVEFFRPGGLLAPTLLSILAVIVPTVVIVGALAYFYNDWRNDALILTDQRLVYIEQQILISQTQHETELSRVQNVRSVVRGLVATVLHYGTIEVETAARGSDIIFGPIPQPQKAQNEIMAQVRVIKAASSAELMRQTLLHRLDPARYPAPESPLTAAYEKDPLIRRQRFALVPNPRIQGSSIIWYKHWYFLIRRLFWQLAFLALLVPAPYFLASFGFPTVVWIIWGGFLFIIGMVVVWNYATWLGDIYEVTNDTMHDIYRTPFGIFGESRRSAGLERIQNIELRKPGLLANILNYGDVVIQTAGTEEFTFLGVPRPDEVQREIYRRQGLYRLRQEQRERDQIADWLVTYQQVQREMGE